jgi:hypothetical protein
MLAVLGAPCLEIGAASFPLLRCERRFTHRGRRYCFDSFCARSLIGAPLARCDFVKRAPR